MFRKQNLQQRRSAQTHLTTRTMKLLCLITSILLLPRVVTQSCKVERTYYSNVLKDCIECPQDPSGCTIDLNKDDLKNCQDVCKPAFQTTSAPHREKDNGEINAMFKESQATSPPREERDSMDRTAILVGIAVAALLLLVALCGIAMWHVQKRRKSSISEYVAEEGRVERVNTSHVQSQIENESTGRVHNNHDDDLLAPKPHQETEGEAESSDREKSPK